MKTMTSISLKKNVRLAASFALAAAAVCSTTAHADWKNSPDCIQRIYLNGVPHTDRNGRPMLKYDAARSFLPISIYHALETENGGVTYKLSDLKAAGFNSAFAWPGVKIVPMAKAAEAAGMQMVFWNPEPDEVKALADSPAMLGWCMDDEPIGYYGRGIEKKFEELVARREAIKANDPTHPVFIVDGSWVQAPVTAWWVKLNTAFDISSHDNYPLGSRQLSLSHTQGLPETVTLALASNKEQKPLWFVVANHEWLDPRFQNTFPTTAQQRCMVYTSLIHGATGIVNFSLDSFVTREARVIGIAPDVRPKYSIGITATGTQMRQARNLWDATIEVNKELDQLRPALLSPTADIPYEIALDDKWESVTTMPVRSLLKVNPAGGYTLLLANIDSTPAKVRVRFPDKAFKVTELFSPEGASMFKHEGDNFDFSFAPYDARVFQIDLN
jgi:hypothetical protein